MVAKPPLGSVGAVHVTVPLPPRAGVLQLNGVLLPGGPLGPKLISCSTETNTAPDGTASVSVTFWASTGPVFVTESV
jgi:hypothetical protein